MTRDGALPDTVAYPATFRRSVGADFDGVFHWEWLQECWPNPADRPMDIDGFKERRGHCLVIETKDSGVPIPLGQTLGLRSLHRLGCSVMLIWGKRSPEYGEFWFPGTLRRESFHGVAEAQALVRRWYQFAENHPLPRHDLDALRESGDCGLK